MVVHIPVFLNPAWNIFAIFLASMTIIALVKWLLDIWPG